MTITLTQFIAASGFLFTVLSFIGGIMWQIYRRTSVNEKALSDYKLEVAERYVKTEQMVEMEKQNALRDERLHASIGALTNRIDRMLERIER